MLNTAQKQAVNCDAKKILCLAGAGTGKTHSVISRISRLINDGADVSSILVLTFTNAAACEMRERYRRIHKNQTSPMFCTFHSYCYSLISRNSAVARSLGYYKGTPNIADDVTIRKIHTRCSQQCGTKISDDKLNGKTPLKSNERFQYDVFWKQYDKLLHEENYITFDIMCYGVSKLFADNDPIVDSEKLKFKYVFVDEFQDTDPKQWNFVSSFTDSNLFVCGDAKQAIYGFRGANSSIIKSLAENPDWVTIKLSENYRSTMEICDYSNKIHKSWKGSAYNLDIVSSKHGIQVVEQAELNLESNKDIMNIVSDSADGKSVAILCRSNYEAAEVKKKLEQLNIPFNSKKTNTDVSGILKSAVDSSFCVDWLSNKLRANDYNVEILKVWCKLTDVNGLQSKLMKAPFDNLANKMSEYIYKFFEGTGKFKSAAFMLTEKANSFSFGVTDSTGTYIEFDLLSSGEKCLYTLAMLLCIVEVSDSPLKLVMIDDLLAHLDTAIIKDCFSTLYSISTVHVLLAGVQDCLHSNADEFVVEVASD